MPCWNFEYTKAVIYTVVKVGSGIGQGPATEVTNLVISTSHLLQMSEHITCMDSNSNRLFKNPKHTTAITSPPKPDITHLHHKQLVKYAKITYLHQKCQTTCMGVNVRLGWKGNCLYTSLCLHTCVSVHWSMYIIMEPAWAKCAMLIPLVSIHCASVGCCAIIQGKRTTLLGSRGMSP